MSQAEITDASRVDAQARLAAIVESSDDAIISKDLDGIILSWNKGAERIFGYSSEEVVGKALTILIPPERLGEEPQILEKLRNGERIEHFETVRVTKSGDFIDVSVTVSPVRDITGKVVGASKIARNISDQKKNQQSLQEARNTAEAANTARDRFLSVLSHELRTPLTPVLAAVTFFENRTDLPEDLRDSLKMIRRNIETEARLVDDLMDLTRLVRGELEMDPEIVDAHAVLANVLKMFENSIDAHRLILKFDLTAISPQIYVDSGRFHQVLLNLISNAVKFTPDYGSITVRSSNLQGTLKLEIIDTGIGIEPDVLPRLFEPFEQGERTITRRFGGLGLGLAIVKRLVGMLAGQITVQSGGKDKGAAFTLTFPTAVFSNRKAPAPAAPTKANPCRILLVEDHDDTRKVLSMLLRSLGCVVAAVGTVKEAREMSDREKFDLLVSDIGLPDGTGIEVYRHISERQRIKAIAISGFGQEMDLRRSREAGFSIHLTKPINFDALRNEIQKIAG